MRKLSEDAMGGVEKRGGRKTSRMTHLPKRGFGPPLYGTFSTPLTCRCPVFSCTYIHDRADQKLFWRGPKNFGRARSLVRFPSPHAFCTPPYHGPKLCRNYPLAIYPLISPRIFRFVFAVFAIRYPDRTSGTYPPPPKKKVERTEPMEPNLNLWKITSPGQGKT